MFTVKFQVEFREGDIVYFKVDQEKAWMVLGHSFVNGQVQYILSTPELGIYEASEMELTIERSVY